MPVFKLTNAEARLAELLWDNAPIASMEMIRLAQEKLEWKKSTTFTILKFLIEKGLAENEKSRVTMLYTRDEFKAQQSCCYVDDIYGGSLPLFIASFTSGRKLQPEAIAELRRLIEGYEGEQTESGSDNENADKNGSHKTGKGRAKHG